MPALKKFASYFELTKLRLTSLVTFSTIAGFVIGSEGTPNLTRLAITAVGTFLTAGGANALNQWMEAERDAKMLRTRGRPLPTRRLSPLEGFAFGAGIIGLGFLLLFITLNPLSAYLSLTAAGIYVLIYTPLKPITSLCTVAGAMVGAIPPLLGYAGAAGRLEFPAFVLSSILFVWQVPHFLALSWAFRKDYSRGGYRMLPLVDPVGTLTSKMILLYGFALIPLSLLAGFELNAGYIYRVGAFLLAIGFLWVMFRLLMNRSEGNAKMVFKASVIYLPLLLILLMLDAKPKKLTTGRITANETSANASLNIQLTGGPMPKEKESNHLPLVKDWDNRE